MNSKNNSLELLIEKATAVRIACTEKKDEDGLKHDPFVEIRNATIAHIKTCRAHIRNRHAKQRHDGNSVEVIKLGHSIEGLISILNEQFRRLSNAYTKQCKQKSKVGLTDGELEKRYAEIGLLKKQIDQLVLTFNSSGAVTINFDDANDAALAKELGVDDHLENDMSKWRGAPEEKISSEDREVLDRWKERDELFDKQLDEIGKAVDNMGSIAKEINIQIEEQTSLAADLKDKVGDSSDEVRRMHEGLKNIVASGQGRFVVRFVLIFAVIIAAAILFSMIVKRFAR